MEKKGTETVKALHGLSILLCLVTFHVAYGAWTGEVTGNVYCDVCGDGEFGPEDYVLEGVELGLLCVTSTREVVNYQAFTDSEGKFKVSDSMPESSRWATCVTRPRSNPHKCCDVQGEALFKAAFVYPTPAASHALDPLAFRPREISSSCS